LAADDAVAAAEAPFDSSRFRHVLGHFATGVAVITAIGPSGPVGMVVSSFTSVSLEPPLVAFLPDKSSTSWPNIRAAGAFCVNILSAGQEALCAQFARKGIDKFAGVTWRPSSSGAPILDGGMAWIDCELTQTFESGDHYIAIGRVQQLEAAEYGVPLVFFQGGYGHFQVPRSAEVSPGPAVDPFEGGWFDELARVTGMDAGDLRRYAKSTEGLVDELVGGYVRAFHDECIGISRRSVPADEMVGDLLQAAFGSMEDNRVAIMILENERQYLATRPEFSYLEPLQRAIDQVWLSTLQRGIDDGDFRAELDVRLAYRFIRDVLFMAARRSNPGRPGPRVDSAHVAPTYRALILNGLLR
jgi:flavin reductase (DIM6/NTAB) family NADH-FMN oxidoreductase RutF/AcrR family transcriptional regulator